MLTHKKCFTLALARVKKHTQKFTLKRTHIENEFRKAEANELDSLYTWMEGE